MRALVAAVVAAAIVIFTTAPHVHAEAGNGDDGCAVCVMRHAGAVAGERVELTAPASWADACILPPGAAPVVGAPQGAVPGQSPPADA